MVKPIGCYFCSLHFNNDRRHLNPSHHIQLKAPRVWLNHKCDVRAEGRSYRLKNSMSKRTEAEQTCLKRNNLSKHKTLFMSKKQPVLKLIRITPLYHWSAQAASSQSTQLRIIWWWPRIIHATVQWCTLLSFNGSSFLSQESNAFRKFP